MTSLPPGVFDNFDSANDQGTIDSFYKEGYVLVDAINRTALDSLRAEVVIRLARQLDTPVPSDHAAFLDNAHAKISLDRLNSIRLSIYNELNDLKWFRPTYYHLGRAGREAIVGNEMVMQNKVNFSIQIPGDTSSLIGIHSDSFHNESPFQVVQWIPLCDVAETKSMYIMKPENNREFAPKFQTLAKKHGVENIFNEYKELFTWIKVPYGKVLIFSPNLLHGNTVNHTPETRWSMNCRFKSLFSPYASSERKLGDFYLPITTKPMTRVGLNFRFPDNIS
jgi:sporadic carbohydrate cluster 2OG-Fe(II) oxygenase